MSEITVDLSYPYKGGDTVGSSDIPASVIGIDGYPYLLDTESGQFRRVGVEVVQQRNTNDARDVLLLPQAIWRQQQSNWKSGAGQTNLDRDDAIQSRFNKSYGVDPWPPWQISLLNRTALVPGTDSLTGTIWLTTVDGYLVVVNDETLHWFDEIDDAAAGSTVVSAGNAVLDIADDGHAATVLTEDRYVWYVDTPASTPTKWANHQYTTAVSFIAWEKDYLLVGDGNVLYNALKGNNPVSIYTHPDTAFLWVSAASGNQCIYVMGSVGDRTTIHRVNIKDDGTGLNPCIVAATLPDGEVGYSIDSYLGFVFIGTSKGVRMAQADANGDLTLGPILPTSTPVRGFEGQDRFVWYTNSSIDGAYEVTNDSDEVSFPSTPVPGLSRMDLSTFTATAITPAYANDLVAESVSGTVQSVVTFDDRRVFSVNGEGVFYQHDELMPAGWLQEGIMSFSVEDNKSALYVQAKWLPLQGYIYEDLSYDSTGFRRIARNDAQGSTRSDNINLSGVAFSRIESRHVLQRLDTDATKGPVMTRWELRASPVKGKASRWYLPIMNYEEIVINEIPFSRNPADEYLKLMALVESGRVFQYKESGVVYQVVARDFEWKPEKLTANGHAWQGVYTLVVEEVR